MKTQLPPTEAQHTPLRIDVDANGTPRLYRGKDYIGVASSREVELYASHASLLSACEAVLASAVPSEKEHPQMFAAFHHLRTAIASARKGEA